MIFSLHSIFKDFQVTFTNNSLQFGKLDSSNECFEIHISEFVHFYETIIQVLHSLDNNLLTKNFFLQNSQKTHFYHWQIIQIPDVSNEYFIKIISECSLQAESYSLILTKEHMFKFLNCFRFFLLTSLPIDENLKIWLKYCSSLSIEQLQDNCILLCKEEQKFRNDLQIDSDLFLLIEIFHYYFSLLNVYKKLSALIDTINKFNI